MRLLVMLLLVLVSTAQAGAKGNAAPAPVIFDTDIGTDIDDAYALALLMRRPELRVLGVTTVSGDAIARARLAAKFMAVAGGAWARVPVYAGISSAPQYMKQIEWAKGYKAPNLHESGGVEFMRRSIESRPGEVTLIAVGELTNVAALLDANPGVARKIRAISLMGGSIYRGYAPDSKPDAEWNIKSNAIAARRVFESGIPLLIAPLDSTADLSLSPEMRVELFSAGLPLNDALASLNSLWRHTNTWKAENPTLFDALAVALVSPRKPLALTPLHIDVTPDGHTLPMQGMAANAEIALEVDAKVFMSDFVAALSH